MILDTISYRIITMPVWVIYGWIGFITALSAIAIFSGVYTTELYYASMFDIGIAIVVYLGIQYYKKKYNFI